MNATTAQALASATLLGLALAHPVAAQEKPATEPATTQPAPDEAVARGAEAKPRSKPLRGASCIDPRAVRSWHDTEDREKLLVDAGRNKYRITLDSYCPGLGRDPRMAFVGSSISGRICGNFGDKIVVRGETCNIRDVELLDEQTFAAALSRDPGMGKPKPSATEAGEAGDND